MDQQLTINETSASEQFHDCNSQPPSPAPPAIIEQQSVSQDPSPTDSREQTPALSAGTAISVRGRRDKMRHGPRCTTH